MIPMTGYGRKGPILDITIVFMLLNVFSIETERGSHGVVIDKS